MKISPARDAFFRKAARAEPSQSNPCSSKVTGSKLTGTGTALYLQSTAVPTADRNHTAGVTDANGSTTSYTYGADHGKLTSVTNAKGQTTSYTYQTGSLRAAGTNGSNVTALAIGTNSGTANTAAETSSSTTATVLDFIYDESGKPFALRYSTDNGSTFTTYYYVLNLQGDVVGLTNSSGAFVAQYSYDAWGNLLSSSGSMATVNPLRYRGYYYDFETGFYYLQSRYYDPANRRFLNADSYASTDSADAISCNMFAYCGNNPVGFYDPTGYALSPVTVAICDGGSGLSSQELRAVNGLTSLNAGVFEDAVNGAESFRITQCTIDIEQGAAASFLTGTNGNNAYDWCAAGVKLVANRVLNLPEKLAVNAIIVAIPAISKQIVYMEGPVLDNGSYDIYVIDAVTHRSPIINHSSPEEEWSEAHWVTAIYFPAETNGVIATRGMGYSYIYESCIFVGRFGCDESNLYYLSCKSRRAADRLERWAALRLYFLIRCA